MELTPGASLTADLRLVRPLGQGAMGSVWVCDHLGLEEQVAVKFVHAMLSKADPHAITRFKREAHAASQIIHPHVVRTHDYGTTDDGTPYIVMELLDGESLGELLERVARLSLGETGRVVKQVAAALGVAHELGIVHRDIKPDNIFLVWQDDGLSVKVLDFGTVKQTRQRADSVVTATGVLVGTPEYMSPEQVLGSRDVDARSDLWGLGVVAYRALTGRMPFRTENPQALVLAICNGEFTALRQYGLKFPEELDPWFARALAPAPDKRFGSAREMAEEFATAIASRGKELAEEATQPSIELLALRRQGGQLVRAGARHSEPPPSSQLAPLPTTPEPADSAPASLQAPPSSQLAELPPVPSSRAVEKALLAASKPHLSGPSASIITATKARRRRSRTAVGLSIVTAAMVAVLVGWVLLRSGEGSQAPAVPTGVSSLAAGAGAAAASPAGRPSAAVSPAQSGGASASELAGVGGAPEAAGGDDGQRSPTAEDIQLPEGPPGFLTVVCHPACHQVVVRGRALGPTPIVRAQLPVGKHQVTLKRAGLRRKSIEVEIAAQHETFRRVTMGESDAAAP